MFLCFCFFTNKEDVSDKSLVNKQIMLPPMNFSDTVQACTWLPVFRSQLPSLYSSETTITTYDTTQETTSAIFITVRTSNFIYQAYCERFLSDQLLLYSPEQCTTKIMTLLSLQRRRFQQNKIVSNTRKSHFVV